MMIALAGILVAGLAKSWDARSEQSKFELARLTGEMKTACVGRFLVDMPKEAQVDIGRARIHGFEVATFDESADEFRARLAEREAEIKSKPDRLSGNKNLELVKEVKTEAGLVGKIFVHSRTVNEGSAGNGLGSEHFRYEGIAVEALVHSEGVSIDLGSDFYFPDRIEDVSRLVAKLVPNARNKIPVEPAFCLSRAYIRGPLDADRGEQVTMFASLPSHPDIDFLLMMAAGLSPDRDGLLKRGTASEERLSVVERLRVARLRAQPRDIRGLAGEELVRRVVEDNDAQVYTFHWEVNGIDVDVITPYLTFSMTTGRSNAGPTPTSMSEDAAVGLWDRILSTIRLQTRGRTHDSADGRLPVAGR
jgi:hypothetical protein